MAPLRAPVAEFAAEHVAPEAGDGERLAGRLPGAPPPTRDAPRPALALYLRGRQLRREHDHARPPRPAAQEAVPYERDPRFAGETNYRLRHMLRLALDGALSFSLRPLRLATWLGFLAASVALAGICYAIAVRLLTDAWVSGWAALFIATLFVGGSQLVVVGILGEYVGRIYGEVKRRPMYFVAQKLGFPAGDDGTSGVP